MDVITDVTKNNAKENTPSESIDIGIANRL